MEFKREDMSGRKEGKKEGKKEGIKERKNRNS